MSPATHELGTLASEAAGLRMPPRAARSSLFISSRFDCVSSPRSLKGLLTFSLFSMPKFSAVSHSGRWGVEQGAGESSAPEGIELVAREHSAPEGFEAGGRDWLLLTKAFVMKAQKLGG